MNYLNEFEVFNSCRSLSAIDWPSTDECHWIESFGNWFESVAIEKNCQNSQRRRAEIDASCFLSRPKEASDLKLGAPKSVDFNSPFFAALIGSYSPIDLPHPLCLSHRLLSLWLTRSMGLSTCYACHLPPISSFKKSYVSRAIVFLPSKWTTLTCTTLWQILAWNNEFGHLGPSNQNFDNTFWPELPKTKN